ncbi:alpha/beta hydrolase [Prosthecomicrobium sp. N25]|uniref:alpha/beta hydrolase n=1 Tax=Prosthecomicrobium sp. N25 TaxID=3129254 RepID=UPI00307763AD
MSLTIDPQVFAEDAVSEETRRLNAWILSTIEALPDTWSVSPAVIRDRRARGLGPFPMEPKCERAEVIEIPGPRGPVALRIIRPLAAARGVYLHLHGGGWTLNAADQQDGRLQRIADQAGLAVVSVDYRLAPEHPYPQGPDDCEAAALWLVREARALFGTDALAIGGESAGAHLSVVTLLRLRDRHGLLPFRAANLAAGCYDLALTPSARRFGTARLVLNTRDIEMFVRHFLLHGGDRADTDVSPIHADLRGLPRALFSVGTRDALLDDSLFMAARWSAAGNAADLAVYPGGVHVFQSFPSALAEACLARMDEFLADAMA